MIARDRIHAIPMDRGRIEEMRDAILARAASRTSGHASFANVHSLFVASKNPAFLAALEASFLVAPDGMPVARALSWLGAWQERYEGMSAFPDLLRIAAERGIPVAFFGSDTATLDAVIAKAAIDLPRLRIVEAIAPALGSLPYADDESHVARLLESGAGMVFVALGCPKQEIWMHSHYDRIPAVMLGVGNAFRTWLGYEKRAPRWMRRLCLEWLIRLIQDPVRLWRRYFVSNSWFLLVVLPELMARRSYRRQASNR